MNRLECCDDGKEKEIKLTDTVRRQSEMYIEYRGCICIGKHCENDRFGLPWCEKREEVNYRSHRPERQRIGDQLKGQQLKRQQLGQQLEKAATRGQQLGQQLESTYFLSNYECIKNNMTHASI